MAGQYTFYACTLTTGRVMTELPLDGFTGSVHLSGGQFTASLSLAGLSRQARIDLVEATTPGKYTVVADRDGQVAGEWIIWKRTRPNSFGAISITGSEVVSYLGRRAIGQVSFDQVEQLVIARTLAEQGFRYYGDADVPGAVAMDIPVPPASGELRSRTYEQAETYILERLTELSQVINGFEFTVRTVWQSVGGIRYVQRTFLIHYPRAGLDLDHTLDMGSQVFPSLPGQSTVAGQGGAAVSFSMDEDASRVASTVFAVGSSNEDGRTLGQAENVALLAQGYPALTLIGTWGSVVRQETIDSHAQAYLNVSQSAEVPPQVSIFVDGDPGLSDLNLGDRVWVSLDPSPNFPYGHLARVRILGWDLAPPVAGREVATLQVTGIGQSIVEG